MDKYQAEVKEKWGEILAYKEYSGKTKDYSRDKWDHLADGMNALLAEFTASMKKGVQPESEEAKQLVSRLQSYITENYYTCTGEILKGLGQMYVADERFRSNIDKHGDGTAEFISQAIKTHCA